MVRRGDYYVAKKLKHFLVHTVFLIGLLKLACTALLLQYQKSRKAGMQLCSRELPSHPKNAKYMDIGLVFWS